MFINLLNSVLSSIAPTRAKPDYEAFAKTRASSEQVEPTPRYGTSSQTLNKQPVSVDAHFYDYLLGKCAENVVEDKLSQFVVEKIVELIHTPEHI